jgi:Cadherin-like
MSKPTFLASLFIRVMSLPEKGYLSRRGTAIVIGDRISPIELERGDITYTSTQNVPFGETSTTDSFTFSMWKTGFGIVTNTMYSECFSESDTPADGIFTFDITIRKNNTPVITIGNPIAVIEESTFPIDQTMFSSRNTPNLESDDLIYTITSIKNGTITVQGKTNNRFTEADLKAGKVLYTNLRLGDGTEQIVGTLCTTRSNCIPFQVNWTITEKFKQTGDNVIYAAVDSELYWEFQANQPDTLWSLIGGTNNAPINVAKPSTKIIEWSSYTLASDLPEGDPGRGYGYDKLEQYRNIREIDMWEGGLPKNISVSSVGSISTGYRLPTSETGSQPWKTPKKPGSYYFTLMATNPRTGEIAFRRYNLVVTISGTSVTGKISESRDL